MISVRKFISITLLSALCSGCSVTAAVKGQSTDGREKFEGTATGYADGSGTLEIKSNRGRTCTGTFVYVTYRDGEGTFTCNDGASGPFRFVSTGTKGTGTGNLNGRQFTFTFGV
ncbi:hypothetical protein [Roseibium sp.]|uniref:hypothetical protein n=1 Tax=Roseibium sp. TaxID=1936156 RepID=UPI003D14B2D4